MPNTYRTDVFLEGDMVLTGFSLSPDCAGQGVLRLENAKDSNLVAVFGAPVDLRKVAEGLLRLADEVERETKRQRTLDNAPVRSRSKFVLEGEKVSKFKRAA